VEKRAGREVVHTAVNEDLAGGECVPNVGLVLDVGRDRNKAARWRRVHMFQAVDVVVAVVVDGLKASWFGQDRRRRWRQRRGQRRRRWRHWRDQDELRWPRLHSLWTGEDRVADVRCCGTTCDHPVRTDGRRQSDARLLTRVLLTRVLQYVGL
jgi:hypothetical protein